MWILQGGHTDDPTLIGVGTNTQFAPLGQPFLPNDTLCPSKRHQPVSLPRSELLFSRLSPKQRHCCQEKMMLPMKLLKSRDCTATTFSKTCFILSSLTR
jgi:hypothetical protein